jgi:Xaa-Pro aminopeptidase
LYDKWIEWPGFELPRSFPREEYNWRVGQARKLMAEEQLDAMVVTSSWNGRYFTGTSGPEEWHDLCPVRATFYVLTHNEDYLLMPPAMEGEHLNAARRGTWVTNIRSVVERFEWLPRYEIWDVKRMAEAFRDIGLWKSRIGWELGDCQVLGLSYNDYNHLKELMPEARFVDASMILRELHQIKSELEISWYRKACAAGAKMLHDAVPASLKIGLTEKEFLKSLTDYFNRNFDENYSWDATHYWDIRNRKRDNYHFLHSFATDREFLEGDFVARGWSGVGYRGCMADIDRMWYLGSNPEPRMKAYYRATWECMEAMKDLIRPGAKCSEIFGPTISIARKYGIPERRAGRNGHSDNLTGISIHPDNHLVLKEGMILQCEPTFADEYGYFDIEDVFLVTGSGCERLHSRAPEELPVISG